MKLSCLFITCKKRKKHYELQHSHVWYLESTCDLQWQMVCHQIVLEACKKDFHYFEGFCGVVGRITDRGRKAQSYSRSNEAQLGLSGSQAEPTDWTPVHIGFQLAGFGVLTEPLGWIPVWTGFQTSRFWSIDKTTRLDSHSNGSPTVTSIEAWECAKIPTKNIVWFFIDLGVNALMWTFPLPMTIPTNFLP